MDINCRRNCYNYGKFGHLVRNCRNWEIVRRERRLEYRNKNNRQSSNLNWDRNLIVLD